MRPSAYWSFYFATSCLRVVRSSDDVEKYSSLRSFILNQLGTKCKMPPVNKTVQMAFEPFQIVLVDALQQTVTFSAAVALSWDAINITWSPSDYGGIESLQIESDSMWSPSIILPKSTQTTGSFFLDMPGHFDVTPYGISATVARTISCSCGFDLSEYPFDEQTCSMPFIGVHAVNVIPMEEEMELLHHLEIYFSTSAEWQITSHWCNMASMYEEGLHHEIVSNYTECNFSMKRRSTFYVVNIICPIILMSSMTLFVFCIPPESGEKMSYVVTIFVATTVFINFIVDVIPRSMEQMPRLVLLVTAVFVKIALCIAATVCVLRLYRKEQKMEQQQQQHKQNEQPQEEEGEKKSLQRPKREDNVSSIQTVKFNIHNGKNNKVHDINNLEVFDTDNSHRNKPTSLRMTRFRAAIGCMHCLQQGQTLTSGQLDLLLLVVMSLVSLIAYSCILMA